MNIFNRKVIANFVSAKFSAIFKLNEKKSESSACALMRRTVRGITIEQSGRSMIEMLGVLSVIAVLSVSGLVGYSKALERYRINETIEQVTYIVQNTRDLFRTQPNMYGSMSFDYSLSMTSVDYDNRKLADKARLFPDSLVKNNYRNIWGGNITFYADGRFSDDDGKAFVLYYADIPQEACIEIATRDWQSSLGLVSMRVAPAGNNDYGIQGSYSGNCTTAHNEKAGRICAAEMPMKLDFAVSVCSTDKNNSISWKFY